MGSNHVPTQTPESNNLAEVQNIPLPRELDLRRHFEEETQGEAPSRKERHLRLLVQLDIDERGKGCLLVLKSCLQLQVMTVFAKQKKTAKRLKFTKDDD